MTVDLTSNGRIFDDNQKRIAAVMHSFVNQGSALSKTKYIFKLQIFHLWFFLKRTRTLSSDAYVVST